MATLDEENIALAALDTKIDTWLQEHSGTYDTSKRRPADSSEFVECAIIYLTNIGGIIERLPASSRRVMNHLERRFTYIKNVRIDYEINRVTVIIAR